MSRPVDSIPEALEEVLVNAKKTPDLKGRIMDCESIADGNRFHGAVKLTSGKLLIILAGSNKRFLNRQLRDMKMKYQNAFVAKVLINIGERLGNVLEKVVNCIRTICHVARCEPDAERDKRKNRARRAKWTPLKNIQPAFC